MSVQQPPATCSKTSTINAASAHILATAVFLVHYDNAPRTGKKTTYVRVLTAQVHIPYAHLHNALFLRICVPCSAGRGLFLALEAAGHEGERVCTPWRTCWSRPGSVTRILGVLGRAIW